MTSRSESAFQSSYVEHCKVQRPSSVFVEKLNLRYSIGDHQRRKFLGLPNFELDVVEFTEAGQFVLHELKLLESSEILTGKVLGQLLYYDFIFSTEPLNELIGRFVMRAEQQPQLVHGDLSRLVSSLVSIESAHGEDGKSPGFAAWNLVCCGGKGFELAAGVNPGVWSLWVCADEYFGEHVPRMSVMHFFETTQGWVAAPMHELSVNHPETLHPEALTHFREWDAQEGQK